MKIKLKSLRKRTMSSLVVLNPQGGSVIWEKIGAVVEINSHEFAYKLLSDYSDMLEEVTLGALDVSFSEKMAEAPKNKAIDTKSTAKIK